MHKPISFFTLETFTMIRWYICDSLDFVFSCSYAAFCFDLLSLGDHSSLFQHRPTYYLLIERLIDLSCTVIRFQFLYDLYSFSILISYK